MLKLKSLFTCLFTVFAFTAFSQTPSVQTSPPLVEGEATSEGMSEERLSRIDMMLNEAIEANRIPGAVALVARNGTVVYHKAFGMADSETGRNLKKDDIFRIASQTKAITATAVMMLWEEGKFQLDDPISKYIPGFKDPQILNSFNAEDTTYTTQPADKPITIRHLLTHTSGIGYGMIDGDERFKKIYQKAGITDLFTTQDITIGESVRKLAKLPLHHHPGEAFTYSEGLDVLGYFIEKVSGMPLNEFFRSRIFDPLGMEDSWFYLPESKHRRLVPVLTKEEGSWKHYPVTFYDPDYPVEGEKQFYSGGAGLSSTAEDYATFLQMYLNGGELNGVRLLSRTTVEFMMNNQIGDLREGGAQDYGLAFGLVNREGETMGGQGSKGTFYWGGYFNTQYFADPEEQVIGILMKQTQGTSDETSWKFKQLVGQAVDD
ncbi:serine hydrolase domain-containing protein [Fodinibius sp.]|uniref:serine hydrolase domain-containing protein n=1 Tax=Fodinibius sp. TaxID=1872440 RepID=UPI003569E362